jgi:hypothetical protein
MVFVGFAKSDRAGRGNVQKNPCFQHRQKLLHKTATAACFVPALAGKIICIG